MEDTGRCEKSHPKVSILKSGRVVFNIKANDYRLIALLEYKNGVVMIRFFGSHEDYDKVDESSGARSTSKAPSAPADADGDHATPSRAQSASWPA